MSVTMSITAIVSTMVSITTTVSTVVRFLALDISNFSSSNGATVTVTMSESVAMSISTIVSTMVSVSTTVSTIVSVVASSDLLVGHLSNFRLFGNSRSNQKSDNKQELHFYSR